MSDMSIDQAIQIAQREVKDVNGHAYLRSIPDAIEGYGYEGLRTQIMYALGNMSAWRGEVARQVKQVMRNWLKESKPE